MAKKNLFMRFYRSLFGKTALIIFAIWAANKIWHLYKEFTAQTPMVHLIAEFDVEGEYVKIDKKIRCYPEGQGGELLQQDFSLYFKFWKSGPRFYGEPRMLGAHLKDGRALLVEAASACPQIWVSMIRNDLKANYVSEYFVPTTALVYDFDNPSRIKFFSSKTAYLSDTAEIKPISYVVKQASKWSMWDSPDEFNWISKDNGNPHYYASSILEFMPLSNYEEENEITLTGLDLKSPTMLKDIPGYEHPKIYPWWLPRTITNALASNHFGGREQVAGTIGDEYSVDNYYPLSIENGIFKPDFTQRGVRVYYKLEKEDLKKSTKDQGRNFSSSLSRIDFKWPNQIQIDQTLLNLIFYKSENYDPEKKNWSTLFYWPKTNRVYSPRILIEKLYY